MTVSDNKQIKFYLDPDLVEFIELESAKRGCSVSHLCNEAIRQRMKRVAYGRQKRISEYVQVVKTGRKRAD